MSKLNPTTEPSTRVAIIGIAGLPASYGGFETLAENLVLNWPVGGDDSGLIVYCGKSIEGRREEYFHSAKLVEIPLSANGPQSIIYDIFSSIDAVRRGADSLLLLGVSGAVALPLLRLMGCRRIVVNIDGLEWRRAKWGAFARRFLRLSEKFAIKFAHAVIADNPALVRYIANNYGKESQYVAYGGDHILRPENMEHTANEPKNYFLCVCRVEPENNVGMVLEAFQRYCRLPLVFVGNWNSSEYGMRMKLKYSKSKNISLLPPVYGQAELYSLRIGAFAYIHGHSAGGTNPSLVEAMYFGCSVIAYDCVFNRETTKNEAAYFQSSEDLAQKARCFSNSRPENGRRMREIAEHSYRWVDVARKYYHLLGVAGDVGAIGS